MSKSPASSCLAAFLSCLIAPAALAQPDSPADYERKAREAFTKMPTGTRTPAERVAKGLRPEQAAIAIALIGHDRQQALDRIARASVPLVFPVYEGNRQVTPLYVAAQRADIELMRAILAKGVSVDDALDANPARRIDGSTALMSAVQNGFGRSDPVDTRMDAIRFLLQRGANPRARNNDGETALGMALRHWWQERGLTVKVVEALLRGGGDINELSSTVVAGETALSRAVVSGTVPLVRFLLEHRADPRAHGSIALVAAASKSEPELLKLMLDNGADPNAAIQQAVVHSFQEQGRKTVTTLLQAGANPDVCNASTPDGRCASHGRPLLSFALERADLALAKELLRHGAKPNAVGGSGETVLGMVVGRRRSQDPNDKFDRLASVNLLLEAGADPNLRSMGELPLTIVQDEELAIIRALLDRGARAEVVALADGQAVGPITLAIARQQYVLAGELVRRVRGRLHASEVHALRAAAVSSHADLARKLIGVGANCNARGPLGETPLHMAAQSGDVAMIAVLLECGADPNARTVTAALAQATYPKALELSQVLAMPKLVNGLETPLMVAATQGSGEAGVARALLKGGANPSLVSEQGKTALVLAREFSQREVERELSGR